MAERKTDIVYFLGAGFSAPFGVPTMKDMVRGFEEEMEFERFRKLKWDLEGKEMDLRIRPEDKTREGLIDTPFYNQKISKEIEQIQQEMEFILKKRRKYLHGFESKFLGVNWAYLTSKPKYFENEDAKGGNSQGGCLDIEGIIGRLNSEKYLALGRGKMIEDYPGMVGSYDFIHMLEPGESSDILWNNGRWGHFNLPELQRIIDRYLGKLKDALFEYIRKVCNPELEHPKLFTHLKQLLTNFRSSKVDLFTTNYDFTIETLLEKMGVAFERGIDYDSFKLRGIPYWDFKKIKECNDWLRLIKLHGSLDLYSLPDGRIIRSPIVTSGGKFIDGKELGEMLIYPTQQKSVNDTPYCDMFKALVEAISQGKVLVFIGFNFNYNDKHISEAVEKGIANNRQLKKVVVVKGQPEDSVKELLKIKGLGRKRIKAIAGRMPKREVVSEIVTTIREVLG